MKRNMCLSDEACEVLWKRAKPRWNAPDATHRTLTARQVENVVGYLPSTPFKAGSTDAWYSSGKWSLCQCASHDFMLFNYTADNRPTERYE